MAVGMGVVGAVALLLLVALLVALDVAAASALVVQLAAYEAWPDQQDLGAAV